MVGDAGPATPARQGANLAAIKKALYALLGGKGVPAPEAVPQVALHIFDDVVRAVDDGRDDIVTKSDLYRYLVLKSESGISAKSVDKLFVKLDVSGDGQIDREEFINVITRCCDMLHKEQALDERLFKSVPDSHVVRGSCKMNARSGTKAFGLQVITRKDMKRLYDIFKEVNTDGSGAIDLQEFKRHMSRNKHLAPMSVSIFYSMDKNRNGSITFKEMLQKLYPEADHVDIKLLMHMANPRDLAPRAKPDLSILEEVRTIFTVYDDDESGTLDEDEFVHAMEHTGYGNEEAFAIFQEIDADGSGSVSFEEFEHWYVNNGNRQARILQQADDDSDDGDG